MSTVSANAGTCNVCGSEEVFWFQGEEVCPDCIDANDAGAMTDAEWAECLAEMEADLREAETYRAGLSPVGRALLDAGEEIPF